MRSAFEQNCRNQTPSDRKLFSRANLLYVPTIKCRGDQDLGLWTTSRLAFGEPQRNDKFRFFLRRNTFFFRKSPLRCGSPNASPEVVVESGVQDICSMNPRFRNASLLIKHVLDWCEKLLAVLHVSSAQIQWVDLSVEIAMGRRRMLDIIWIHGRLTVAQYGA